MGLMHPLIKRQIFSLAATTPDQEICGFIYGAFNGEARILPCRNIAADPATEFQIDPQDQILAHSLGTLFGVYHSHPAGGGSGFSPADMALADEYALPLYLATPDQQLLQYIPLTYRVGTDPRPFVWGFADCYELVRDHFRENHQVYLGDYDRDHTAQHEDANLVLQRYETEGFVRLPVDTRDFRLSDVLVFRSNRVMPQHFGVFIGEGGYMRHHVLNMFSRKELISYQWWQRLYAVARHKSLL